MAKPAEYKVDSIAAFSGRVEELLTAALTRQASSSYRGLWYRGQGSATKHTLIPTLYRHPKLKNIEDCYKMERQMLDDFVRHNVLHTSGMHASIGPDDFRTLFFMQHYSVPTRLLDWSLNPFIALYFALTSAERKPGTDEYTDDAAVWVLDPVDWNDHALADLSYGKEGPLTLESDMATGYRPPDALVKGKLKSTAVKSLYDNPVAILGVSNNARMFAQRGVFTIFGKKMRPMEEQHDKEKYPSVTLAKILIPKKKIEALLDRLLSIGYTDSVSYPDLHGLALEMKRLRGFRV